MHWPNIDTGLIAAVAGCLAAFFSLLNNVLNHVWRRKDDAVKQVQTELLRTNTDATLATAQTVAEHNNLTMGEMLDKAAAGWKALRARHQIEDDDARAEEKAGRR